LSNCAKAAITPSISFPVDVSSIGSVGDRSEMPSDFRCERSAKWSYLSVKTGQVKDNQEVHLALVMPAVRKHFLKFASVRSFRAFSFFLEALEDLETFSAAARFADSELCRQAEVSVCSFACQPWLVGRSRRAEVGTDAAMNHRTNRGSQA
jgi:hypothetical protein